MTTLTVDILSVEALVIAKGGREETLLFDKVDKSCPSRDVSILIISLLGCLQILTVS